MNLDQVMNIGEDFEGYIEQLNVNFIPYALTINNKVPNSSNFLVLFLLVYLIIIFSFQICIYHMRLLTLSLNYRKNDHIQIYPKQLKFLVQC